MPALKTQRMQVGGMDCTSCAIKIEGAVEKLAGVVDISVVVATRRLIVTYDPVRVSEADIQKQVTGLGYTIGAEKSPAQVRADEHSGHDHSSHQNHSDRQNGDKDDHRVHDDHSSSHHDRAEEDGHNHGGGEFNFKHEVVIVGVVLTLFVLGSGYEKQLTATPYSIGLYLVFIPAYLLSGWTVLTTAGKNILRGQVFDENFLMTIATVGAIAIKQLPEAVGVMLFFKIGELFQELAVSKSR